MQEMYRELLIKKMIMKQKCSTLSKADLEGKYKRSYEQLCDIQETLNRVLVCEDFKETAHMRVKIYLQANLGIILRTALKGDVNEYERLIKQMLDNALEGYQGYNGVDNLYSLNFVHELGLEKKENLYVISNH